jgi:PAS domain S-box-containing protein
MPAMASPGHGFESKHLLGIIDSIPSLIHTGRPDGYLDYFNQPWLRYVGLPLEELLSWKWTAAIHPEDVEAVVNRWRFSLASGEPFLHEARVRRADGEYRWMLHHKVAVRDGAGDIVKWYGSSIDIEDRKRAEEAQQRTESFLAEGQRLSHTGSWAFNPAGIESPSCKKFGRCWHTIADSISRNGLCGLMERFVAWVALVSRRLTRELFKGSSGRG